MNYNNLRFCKWRLVMLALFALGVQSALAKNAPLVSGSYQVVESKDLGSESQIQIRIHLVNHGSSDFSIQRMTLWDLSHADKGGTSACTVALRAHASAETTQQFTIRRSDYQSWQRGFRPRLVLQMAGPGRAKSKTVVRLDRVSGREAK
ncbi:MAG TPA: hypothetical protein VJX47_09515 [Candidatus Sulfotelmatobacter sp.]|nr:hypothetical protein [Candidatus Sulfotelmatobacter sp.]